MATATGNYVCDNSTLTNFKSWAQAISGAFSTFGWTQTTDTGQVNWSSIASVPSSTYVYEIWKAADTLAATMPIYVRVEYGFSSTSIRLRFTVGTGSDGAGTINGHVMSGAPWNMNSAPLGNQGATTFPCFFSGTAGEFRMYMWQSASIGLGVLFAIERSKDSTGTNTADYVTAAFLWDSAAGAVQYQQSILSSGLVGNLDAGLVAPALTNQSNTGSFNGTVASFPVFPVIGKVGNPMLGVMTVVAGDVTSGTTVTVASAYAATHTYVAVKGASTGFSFGAGQRSVQAASMAILMRYE